MGTIQLFRTAVCVLWAFNSLLIALVTSFFSVLASSLLFKPYMKCSFNCLSIFHNCTTAANLSLPILSSAFSLCYLTNLQNCNSFMVFLCYHLNLLLTFSETFFRISGLLLCLRGSESCRTCLSSQFFIIGILSVWLLL